MSDFVIQKKLGKKENQKPQTSRTSALSTQGKSEVKLYQPAKAYSLKDIPKREFIPKSTKKWVYTKAEGCCQYVSPLTGKRCGSRYQLQIDHRIPISKRGGNAPENLRLLCRTHNLSEARHWGLAPREPR